MSSELATLEAKAGALQIVDLSSSMEFARLALKSGLIPSSFKSAEAVMIAVQQGAELGLKPMASLNVICVINGRPSLWGKGIPAICMNSKLVESWSEWEEGEGENLKVFCKSKRKGLEGERVSSFSVQDAKRAGLWTKPGPWQQYPRDQLAYKARARCLGILYSDVLCGLPVYEDIRDIPPDRKEPREVAVVDPLLNPGPIIKSIESDEPAIQPEQAVSELEESGKSIYAQYMERFDDCGAKKDLVLIGQELAGLRTKLTEDQHADLRNRYAELLKELK